MVELFFSLRFQSQLRRIRPALLRQLEQSITGTIEGFAGKVSVGNKLISASFNEENVGFALDMLCVLDNLKKALELGSTELYGHLCVLGKDIRDDLSTLMQNLPSDRWDTGIWCDSGIRELLEPFIDFEQALAEPEYSAPLSGYTRVKGVKEFLSGNVVSGDNSEMINKYMKQGVLRNTVIVGAPYTGKREGLYRYCEGSMGDFPPLLIRFGYANAVTCIVDCLSPDIKKILAKDDLEKLEEQAEILFRERLRDEVPEFLAKRALSFFSFFLEAYKSAASRVKVHPVLILENIEAADPLALAIIGGAYKSLSKGKFYLYGTCTDILTLKPWEDLFPRIIKFSPTASDEGENPEYIPDDLPKGLWEMAYACALFSRYFPGYLVPRLFIEEGKNPIMIDKTLLLLAQTGLINSVSNPSPRRPEMISRAEKALGDGAKKITALVRKRLLAWVYEGRLKACYRLLEALCDLGGKANEILMLEAICGDVTEGVYKRIEEALEDGSFNNVTGENSAPLLSIFRTQKALVWGNSDDIKEAFVNTEVPPAFHPGFRAWINANLTCFNLGICDFEAATASVKETMLITQQENKGRFLARVYRLFSLVNFSTDHLSDAIDYFTFALEDAEKDGNREELALINFYSSAVHFVFGNLSKAERLAQKAEEAALASGQSDWADRIKFFRGRICFEVGHYQKALDIFNALETEFYGAGSQEFKAVLAAWIYRAKIYLPLSKGNNPVYSGFDARLFEIENAYLSGDYRKTLELADTSGEVMSKDRFLYIEQPDWRSGFAQCELFLFPLRELWDRVFLCYRALALCHLYGAEQHQQKDEAIREMRHVMRDELSDTDPNAAFYFYAYYQVLKLSKAPEVDMNTAISLAFKRLQRRASRIDDNETRRAFLTQQYWNSALEKTAREHKLI